MTTLSPDEVARYFESMTPEALTRLDTVYAQDAFFKDPFNEVTGQFAFLGVFNPYLHS